MKFSAKKVLGVCLFFVLLIGLVGNASAAGVGGSAAKIPDALNVNLEKQKLGELSKLSRASDNSSSFSIEYNKPFVISFDDGSSIVYTAKKEITPFGGVNLSIEKDYLWSAVGYAKITGHVSNCSLVSINNGNGYQYQLSGNSNDIYQSYSTGFSTVLVSSSEAKNKYTSLYDIGVVSRDRGNINYNIAGVTHQTDYEFIWVANPLDASIQFTNTY